MPHDSKNDKEDKGALAAALNAAATSRVMRQHSGIFIRPDDLAKWRVTKNVKGVVEGFEHLGEMTCLMTNGLLAWLVQKDEKTLWLGHVDYFQWTEGGKGAPGPLFPREKEGTSSSTDPAKQRTSSEKKPKKSAVQRALDLLLGKG